MRATCGQSCIPTVRLNPQPSLHSALSSCGGRFFLPPSFCGACRANQRRTGTSQSASLPHHPSGRVSSEEREWIWLAARVPHGL